MDFEKFQKEDLVNSSLTVRILMQGKEIGSIIGKKGEIVKRFRDESGARINISDGVNPERVITVTGSTQCIKSALSLICSKIEEEIQAGMVTECPRIIITLRIIMPASQCGSLIGKAGVKIKEIKETCGVNIQVGADLLPNSTERAVTIIGAKEAVVNCVFLICQIMVESPAKGLSIPFRPKSQMPGPVILTPSGQTFAIHVPTPENVLNTGCGNVAPYAMVLPPANMTPFTVFDPIMKNGPIMSPTAITEMNKISPIPGLANLGVSGIVPQAPFNPALLAAFTGAQIRPMSPRNHHTHEMTVANEYIGCIIGKGGSKIAEIRQASGAIIRISNCEQRDNTEGIDRTITITGSPDAISIALYLINMSLEQQKYNFMYQNQPTSIGMQDHVGIPHPQPQVVPEPHCVPAMPEILFVEPLTTNMANTSLTTFPQPTFVDSTNTNNLFFQNNNMQPEPIMQNRFEKPKTAHPKFKPY